jgi:sugar-specific transcriptional regulator TrmB
MFQDECIQTLTGFGLTFLQAKVYLALVLMGNSTVKKISVNTHMARQEAQRVVYELGKIGLVEKLLGHPSVFKPVSIEDCVSFLLERREKASLELEQKASVLLRTFHNVVEKKFQSMVELLENDSDGANQFIIINGKEAIIRKSRMILDRTKVSCDIIGGFWENVSFAGSVFRNENIDLLKRHVKIRIVVEKFASPKLVEKIYEHCINNPYFEIRFKDNAPSVMLGVYDERELIVNISPKERLGDSPLFWTNNHALVTAAQTYFDKMWGEILICR